MSIERKLAAIMFTDIAGYTAQMSESESKSLDLLEKKRSILKPLLKEYKGTFVKEIGDGTLSYFESAVNAATCAVKLQEHTYDDSDMNIRAGIHIGDIVFKDGDVFGDGVNVASRLEGIAPKGGVCVSKNVYDELLNQEDFDGIGLGLQSLKGVGRLIEVFGLKGDKLNEPNPEEYRAKKIAVHSDDEVPSIAIIPFNNKGREEDTFFSYGISADLITNCAGAGLIRVASLEDIEKIEKWDKLKADELSSILLVRYIAQGTLWKMNDDFQLSIELYDTKDSKVLWSDRWQEKWDNLSMIKNKLSDSLLKILNLKVQCREDYIIPESYEYYLKAKHNSIKAKSNDDFLIIKDLIQQSIKIDNNNIEAKITLGLWYLRQNDVETARELVGKTLKDSKTRNHKLGIGFSLHVLGNICIADNDYDGAINKYNESLNVFKKSNNIEESACSLTMLGHCYTRKFKLDKALKYLDMAYKIKEDFNDKYHNSIMLTAMGNIYVEKGELNKGIDYYEQVLEIRNKLENYTGIADILLRLAYCYFYKEEYKLALEYYERSYKMQKNINIFYSAWWTPILLELTKKKLDKQFKMDGIQKLIKDKNINSDVDGYRINLILYELLEEISYIENANNLILDKADSLEVNLKAKFLNSHIPRIITEEYNKVFKK